MKAKTRYSLLPVAWLVFFTNLTFPAFAQQPAQDAVAEIPKNVDAKIRRDAARLALRTVAGKDQLPYQHTLIPSQKTEEFYRMLSGIYKNHPIARSIEKLDVHTFPNPSIDRLVLIFEKNVQWAQPLREGSQTTGHTQLDGLMAKYDLTIDRYVKWDDANDAIILRSQKPLNMAALAVIFSKIKGVAGVDTGVPETTGNDIRARQIAGGWEISYILVFGSHINGKGKMHTWKFQAMEGEPARFLGESGDVLPAWAQATFETGN